MTEPGKVTPINTRTIVLNVSVSNVPIPGRSDGKSLYKRLKDYADSKGIKEQDAIRFAISMLLDKTGF